jgi:hypothetical protein
LLSSLLEDHGRVSGEINLCGNHGFSLSQTVSENVAPRARVASPAAF